MGPGSNFDSVWVCQHTWRLFFSLSLAGKVQLNRHKTDFHDDLCEEWKYLLMISPDFERPMLFRNICCASVSDEFWVFGGKLYQLLMFSAEQYIFFDQKQSFTFAWGSKFSRPIIWCVFLWRLWICLSIDRTIHSLVLIKVLKRHLVLHSRMWHYHNHSIVSRTIIANVCIIITPAQDDVSVTESWHLKSTFIRKNSHKPWWSNVWVLWPKVDF